MAARRGSSPEHPALAQLRGYWEGLRVGGELPSRAQIDPRGIERALEHAFIAERLAPGVARFRLAGMHLNELLGTEVRGMPLTTFFEPDARDEVQRQVERAFAGPAAVELVLEAPRGLGRPALSARMLLLPLRNEAGEVARILGGLAAEGDIGRAPRRFRLSCAEARAVMPGAAVPDAVIAAALRPTVSPSVNPVVSPSVGFSEPAAPYGADAPLRKRGHLRLVHSAD